MESTQDCLRGLMTPTEANDPLVGVAWMGLHRRLLPRKW